MIWILYFLRLLRTQLFQQGAISSVLPIVVMLLVIIVLVIGGGAFALNRQAQQNVDATLLALQQIATATIQQQTRIAALWTATPSPLPTVTPFVPPTNSPYPSITPFTLSSASGLPLLPTPTQLILPIYPTATYIEPPTQTSVALGSLKVGIEALVSTTARNTLSLRSVPGQDRSIIAEMPSDTRVEIVDGPQAVDGSLWWKVQVLTSSSASTIGKIGWCSEFDGKLQTLTAATK